MPQFENTIINALSVFVINIIKQNRIYVFFFYKKQTNPFQSLNANSVY